MGVTEMKRTGTSDCTVEDHEDHDVYYSGRAYKYQHGVEITMLRKIVTCVTNVTPIN